MAKQRAGGRRSTPDVNAQQAAGASVSDLHAPLYERDTEVAVIARALQSASTSSGTGILIEGAAGIGKTSLLEAGRELAVAKGMGVLVARGGMFERGHPFGIARQLLSHLASTPNEREKLLQGAAWSAAPLFDGSLQPLGAPDTLFSLTYGLFWALVNMAERRPLLVCVDDLQWVDEPSLHLMIYLLQRAADVPITICVALRTGEAIPSEFQSALGELEAAGLLHVLDPQALSSRASFEVARDVFGDRATMEFAAACHERTGGNPFFLVELLHEFAEEHLEPTDSAIARIERLTPRGIARVVLARLARYGPEARALARAIAVLGTHGQLVDAGELVDLPRPRAVEAAETLVSGGVLCEGSAGLEFTHPLVQDAVTTDMSDAVLGEFHARAADILARHGRDVDVVATHALLSPRCGSASTVERLRGAAALALTRGAPERAVALLARALSEPPTPEAMAAVLNELGTAETAAQRPEAIEHLTSALERSHDKLQRALITLGLARNLMPVGRSGEAFAALTRAKANLDNTDPIEREASLALDAMRLMTATMDPSVRATAFDKKSEYESLIGVTAGERAVLACLAFDGAKRAEPVSATLDLADRAVERGGCELGAATDPFTVLMLLTALQWSGQLSHTVALTSAALDEARSMASSALFAELLASRAMTHWRLGLLAESEADARQSLEIEGLVSGVGSLIALSALTRALLDQGDLVGAHNAVSRYPPLEDREDLVSLEILLTLTGRVYLQRGLYQDALTHLAKAGDIAEAAGSVNPLVSEWRVLTAEAYIGVGRHDEAKKVLVPALVAARRYGGSGALGPALRVAGLAEQPINVESLQEAVDVLEASEFRLELTSALIDLGAALRRSGQRRTARDALEAGLETADRCGARPLAERARDELLATGARPRRTQRTGLESLTPSERRVVRIAAQGRTNREIAQALFVSPRTVEAHLRSAYSKLGVNSRRDLEGIGIETSNLA